MTQLEEYCKAFAVAEMNNPKLESMNPFTESRVWQYIADHLLLAHAEEYIQSTPETDKATAKALIARLYEFCIKQARQAALTGEQIECYHAMNQEETF